MRNKQQLFFLLFCFGLVSKPAYSFFEFNAPLEQAYWDAVNMDTEGAKQHLAGQSENGCTPLIANYIDFLELFMRGNPQQYKQRKPLFAKRINTIKRNEDSDSPYYLYAQGEIYLQSAVLHIQFGEYFASVWDIRRAFNKLDKARKEHPTFLPASKAFGLLLTILGSVPEQFTAGLDLLGLEGDVSRGMNLLNGVYTLADEESALAKETQILLAFLSLHIQNDSHAAYAFLEEGTMRPATSLTDAFAYAHIGIYGGRAKEGIRFALQHIDAPQFKRFPHINYLIGLGYLQLLDSKAEAFFLRYLELNEDENHRKATLHKLGWLALIEGDTATYNRYMKRVETEGIAVMDADKQAEQEATEQTRPHTILLRARLLCDGHHYQKALDELQSVHINHFDTLSEKTEYYYRMARIYHGLEQWDTALAYYEVTYQNGFSLNRYFAANSAFQTGFIYESQGDSTKARQYYNMALKPSGYAYENSIRQKAKAGLDRLR